MPPPPPPSFPSAPTGGATPAGYVAYQQAGVQRSVRGLGTAVLVMYGVVTGCAVLLAGAFFRRWSVVDEIFDRGTQVSSAEQARIADTDTLVVTTSSLLLVAAVVAGVITAVWAHRIAKNAVARGAYDVSPGMAAGGWFIPFGMWWLPFREVRKSVETTGRSGDSVRHWQVAWLVTSLLGYFMRRNINEFDTSGADAFVSSLQRQWVLGGASAALYAISLWFAWRAVRTASAALHTA